VGEGEDEMEGTGGKEFGLLFIEPAGFGEGLALGAVARAAGVVGGVLKTAGVALVQVAAELSGAAAFDGAHDLEVLRRQGVCAAVLVPMLAEDVGQFVAGFSRRRSVSGGQHGAYRSSESRGLTVSRLCCLSLR